MQETPKTSLELERLVQRRVTAICALVAACLFCFLSVGELQAGEPTLSVVTGCAALISGVVSLLTLRFGVNTLLLRVAMVYVLAVLMVETTQPHFSVLLLFSFVVPFVFSLLLGTLEAMIWSLLTGVIAIGFYQWHGTPIHIAVPSVVLVSMYGVALVISLGYEKMRSQFMLSAGRERDRLTDEISKKNEIADRNEKLFSDLSTALREVSELTGLIPMCASCKKIRGDEDFWEHVEAYLHKRTQLQFSHGLCPDCSDEAMDDIDHHHLRADRQP